MTFRPRRAAAALLVAASALLVTACGSTPTASPTLPTPSQEPTVTNPTLKPLPPEPPRGTPGVLPTGPVPEAVASRADVRRAVDAEAVRAGVAPQAVEVAGYADVIWTDGSLGCPQPGMAYSQGLVPGHQLVLRVGDKLASYHAAAGADFRYCAAPIAPAATDPNK